MSNLPPIPPPIIDEQIMWQLLDFVAIERQRAKRNVVLDGDYHDGTFDYLGRVEERIRAVLPPRNADRCPECDLFVYDLRVHMLRHHATRVAAGVRA